MPNKDVIGLKESSPSRRMPASARQFALEDPGCADAVVSEYNQHKGAFAGKHELSSSRVRPACRCADVPLTLPEG